ncbi:MAG: Flp pilus assembly protein RcpC/CpaB [Frankiaceae bacterium]|nr:Flp pilus assembly protein RcpC/CpaB [Frankiaceae bacterium]
MPVQPGHVGDGLGRGDLVDVYLTPKTGSGAAVPAPTLVIAGVPVESRDGGARTFAGSASLAVVLAVPAADVAALVHAIESGIIDLVTLPRSAAAAGPASAADSR